MNTPSSTSAETPAKPAAQSTSKGRLLASLGITLVVGGIAEVLTPGGVSSRLGNMDFVLYVAGSTIGLFLYLTFVGVETLPPKLRLAALLLIPAVVLFQAGAFKSRPSPRYTSGYVPAAQTAPYGGNAGYVPSPAGGGSKPLKSRWVETKTTCTNCGGNGEVGANCYACNNGTAPGGGSCSTCGGDGRKMVDCSSCTNGTVYGRKEVFE